MHDRPHWWSDDGLPRRREDWRRREQGARYYDPYHYEDERYGRRYQDEREARGFDEQGYERARDDDGRDWADKAADEVKSWFGNDRAERRRERDHARERRHGHDERHAHRRDFRGVGPHTRHDEDEELRDAICARLADDPDLDASGILVRVIDNEAILDGAVDSQDDASRAYELALDVPGVVHVRDRLDTHRSRRDRVRRATIGMGYDEHPRRWRS